MKVLAAALYDGTTLTCGVPACAYLLKGHLVNIRAIIFMCCQEFLDTVSFAQSTPHNIRTDALQQRCAPCSKGN